MGRHVIRPFRRVLEQGITIRHQPRHVTFQVRTNIGVGILAQHQRGTGVMQKQVAQAGTHTGIPDARLYGIRHMGGTPPAGPDSQPVLEYHGPGHSALAAAIVDGHYRDQLLQHDLPVSS